MRLSSRLSPPVLVAALLALVLAPAAAWAARSPSPSDNIAGAYAAIGFSEATANCLVAEVSTVDQSWAYLRLESTLPAGCPVPAGGVVAWFLHRVGGQWSVTATSTSYAVSNICPVFFQPLPSQPIYADVHPCGTYPTTTAPAPAPSTGPTPAPVAGPTPTPPPTPAGAPATGSSGSTSTGDERRPSKKTKLLCRRSISSNARKARRKPSSCNTLGRRGSFAGNVNLAKLRWRHWGYESAFATGIERGYRSPASRVKVRVEAWWLRPNDCGGWSYTRLRVTSKYGTTLVDLPPRCRD